MFFERQDRKIIPRWRDFLTTAALGELTSTTTRPTYAPTEADLAEAHSAWLENKTLWHALDLIGSAFSVGVNDASTIEAAKYIAREHFHSSPKAGLALALRMLGGTADNTSILDAEDESGDTRAQIHERRRQTQTEPRNPIAWVDLARLYTVAGQIPQAQRAVETALRLSPTNRFVLRSATRFFVHIGERERALRLLRATEIFNDPWIAAAEIGVSTLEQESPSNVKLGRKLVEDASLSSFAKTELASALATLELQDGRNGKARKLFRRSLEQPNENSLAQAEWASAQIPQLEVDVKRPSVIRSYEARTLLGLKTGDWELTAKNSLNWLHDQPFSSMPAATASYIFSAIYDQQSRAEDILRQSLISNPRDPGLMNNLAFALADQNKIAEAEEVLSSVNIGDADDSERVTLLATAGLVAFRKGLTQEGRTLYLNAMDLAKQKGFTKFEALAAVYLAREEIRAKMSEAFEDLRRAEEMASRQNEPDVALVLKRVSDLATQRDTLNAPVEKFPLL